MTEYRRAHAPGASWFFTVNLAQRKGNSLLVDRIGVLRAAFERVRERYVLPGCGGDFAGAFALHHDVA